MKIPTVLALVIATVAILVDAKIYTPGSFGWLSHITFWPALAVFAYAVYDAVRSESLNEKARRK
ncbi:hypothetical protein [Hymenobacter guriensis]|uniref:DUF3311 domain-containing protein n=1 Tax=Hymenobacter guriensis TaxID=2793065 RepID=A0ABS0KWX1_9BACT|nr:hypothetical protein [Hymenobacter guriensis]MBG8552370.1 hypothetical protein [Hymenobacter guriensis]